VLQSSPSKTFHINVKFSTARSVSGVSRLAVVKFSAIHSFAENVEYSSMKPSFIKKLYKPGNVVTEAWGRIYFQVCKPGRHPPWRICIKIGQTHRSALQVNGHIAIGPDEYWA
jgi:hypothetical protein